MWGVLELRTLCTFDLCSFTWRQDFKCHLHAGNVYLQPRSHRSLVDAWIPWPAFRLRKCRRRVKVDTSQTGLLPLSATKHAQIPKFQSTCSRRRLGSSGSSRQTPGATPAPLCPHTAFKTSVNVTGSPFKILPESDPGSQLLRPPSGPSHSPLLPPPLRRV